MRILNFYSNKCFIVCLLLITGIQVAKSQDVLDANFITAIQAVCPTCVNNAGFINQAAANTVTSLNVSCNSITDLTGILKFTNLQTLDCSNNNLSTIVPLPASLLYLRCYDQGKNAMCINPQSGTNCLMSLPPLPSNLLQLNASDNCLISLPDLPASLTSLVVDNNQLTSLPKLSGTQLTTLSVNTNNLTSIPPVPSTLQTLSVGCNLKLACLPILPPNFSNLDAGCGGSCSFSTSLSCIPAPRPTNMTSSCRLLLQCTPTPSNACSTSPTCPTTTHNNTILLTCSLDSVGFIKSVKNVYDDAGACLLSSDTTKLALNPCCARNIITLTKTLTTCDATQDQTTRKDTIYNKTSGCIDSIIVSNFFYKPCCPLTIYSTVTVNTCDPKLDGTTQSILTTSDINACLLKVTTNIYKYAGLGKATIAAMCPYFVASNGLSWQWYLNGVKIIGATGQAYYATTYGDYQVLITYAGGCSSLSDIVHCETDFADNCPQIHKNFGASCNDGNPNTTNDRVRNDCQCRGDLTSTHITAKCPKDTIVVSTDIYGTVVNYKTEFHSDCTTGGIDLFTYTQTSGYYSGYPFPPNTKTAIEIVATDMCGNKSSCSFFVTTTPVILKTNVPFTDNFKIARPTINTVMINHVSPNPATDNLNVSVYGRVESSMQLRVFNALGQEVLSETKQLNIGANEISLNISNLTTGMYFISTANNPEQIPHKFIKN